MDYRCAKFDDGRFGFIMQVDRHTHTHRHRITDADCYTDATTVGISN